METKGKPGRPQIHEKDAEGKNANLQKMTIEIDKEVYLALQRKKVEEGLKINKYMEELLRANIEPEYFRSFKE